MIVCFALSVIWHSLVFRKPKLLCMYVGMYVDVNIAMKSLRAGVSTKIYFKFTWCFHKII